jgi:hypothetical protein
MSRLFSHIIAGYLMACFSFCSMANASFFDLEVLGIRFDTSAPYSVGGMTVNFQIENATSTLPNGFATQGVIVAHYKKDGTWTAKGIGGSDQRASQGTYIYKRISFNKAVEKAVDQSGIPYTTHYTFDTPNSGKWAQNFNNGQIISKGSFTLISTHSENQVAPDTIKNLNVGLFITDAESDLPPGVYPKKGLAVQTYAEDGSMTITGYGPHTLNSTGTYSYKKVSANTAVEEVLQVSPIFTLPYTMVYTFETPTSGTWYQNLGNGFITFRGNFQTTPN